jgi:hypothetical protein
MRDPGRAARTFSVSAPTFLPQYGREVHIATSGGQHALCSTAHRTQGSGLLPESPVPLRDVGYGWNASSYKLCPDCESGYLAIPAAEPIQSVTEDAQPFQTVVELDPDQAKALGFLSRLREQPKRFLVETSYRGEDWVPQLVSLHDLLNLLRTNCERLANYGDGYEIEIWLYEGKGNLTPVYVDPVEFGRQAGDQREYEYRITTESEEIAQFVVVGGS